LDPNPGSAPVYWVESTPSVCSSSRNHTRERKLEREGRRKNSQRGIVCGEGSPWGLFIGVNGERWGHLSFAPWQLGLRFWGAPVPPSQPTFSFSLALLSPHWATTGWPPFRGFLFSFLYLII
jgi:hypothetical protein